MIQLKYSQNIFPQVLLYKSTDLRNDSMKGHSFGEKRISKERPTHLFPQQQETAQTNLWSSTGPSLLSSTWQERTTEYRRESRTEIVLYN